MAEPERQPELDFDQAQAFLDSLGNPDHLFALIPEGTSKNHGKPKHLRGTLAGLAHALQAANQKGCGVFVTINEVEGWNRKAEDVTQVRAVFVDLDGAPLDPVLHGPLEPHYVIETSPGRYHVYWLVTGDVPLEVFKPIQQRLSHRFGGDKMVCDLPRIMRLPGSLNQKRGIGSFVSIIQENNLAHYTLADIEKAFPADDLALVKGKSRTDKVVRLADYRNPSEDLADISPPDFEKIVASCGFIRHCIENAAELGEPAWWSSLSIAAHCAGGEQIVHDISMPYPGYSQSDTSLKVQNVLEAGKPHTCQYIEETICADYCHECPHRGRIKSPITLGYSQNKKRHDDDDVHADVAALNDVHAFILIAGKAFILNIGQDVDGKLNVTFSSEIDFRKRYANQYYTVTGPKGGSKHLYIADEWLRWPKRRQYDGLCFRPGRPVPDRFYNAWQGFAVVPKEGSWELMKQHILEVICDGNQEIYTWLIAYMARIVQDPGGDRPGVSIVLLGQQGTGKGIFMRNFGALFGSHYLHITSQDQLTGRFNSHLMHTVVLFVDEGFWGGDKAAEGKLKGLITEPTIQIEGKGKDSITSENHINLISASNNDWAVPAGLEERRFMAVRVSSKYMQDHAYFKRLQQEMDDGGREAMMHDFQAMDISEVNLRQAPRTQALREQIEHSLHSAHRFWYEGLKDEVIPTSSYFMSQIPSTEVDTEWEGWHFKNYVYEAYLDFCRAKTIRHQADKGAFLRKIQEVCPSFRLQRETSGKRRQGYVFPSLDVSRREFETAINIKVPWGTE